MSNEKLKRITAEVNHVYASITVQMTGGFSQVIIEQDADAAQVSGKLRILADALDRTVAERAKEPKP